MNPIGISSIFFFILALTMIGQDLFITALLLGCAVICAPPVRQIVMRQMLPYVGALSVTGKALFFSALMGLVLVSGVLRALVFGPSNPPRIVEQPAKLAASVKPKETAKPAQSAKPSAKPEAKATAKPVTPTRPARQHSAGSDNSRLLAHTVSESAIKERLTAPSSAKFPGSRDKLDSVQHMGANRYRVDSHVESQNAFGVMARNRFVAVVRLYDDGSEIESLAIE